MRLASSLVVPEVSMLRIGEFEAGEPDVSLIGPAIAVGVLREEYLRSGAHKCAVAIRENSGRVWETVEKDSGLVVGSVLVLVRENHDFAARLAFVINAAGIVAHLDDPQPPIGPDRHVDRIGNQRLGRNHTQLHLFWNRKRLQGLVE